MSGSTEKRSTRYQEGRDTGVCDKRERETERETEGETERETDREKERKRQINRNRRLALR